MEFIKIERDCSWGREIIFIQINEIRCVQYHVGPGFIIIYYLNKMVCGHVQPDFDRDELMWKIRHNEYVQLLIQENFELESESE